MAREGRQRPMSLASALLFLSLSNSSHFYAAADKTPSSLTLSVTTTPVADSKCNCFVTNGSDTAYFSHHTFFDFRSLTQFQGTPELLPGASGTTNAAATSGYFTSSNFTSFWQAQNWNNSVSAGTSNATLLRINSLNNIYIEKNTDSANSSSTWLSLRTARQSTFQSTAEIVTQNDTFQFLSMRMLARTIGSPGGCMGMFTYRDDSSSSNSSSTNGGGGVQEVDLEVLTKYPREHVQCTNQPSLDDNGQLITAATQNVTLPMGLGWDDWAVYRLDWTPRQSTWYVDGEQIANISFQTPRDPTSIHINAWSDGSKWTGSMAPNTEAHLQIQWWEVLYNSTPSATKRDGGGSCSAVCSIDANGPPGQAMLVSDNSSNSSGAPSRLPSSSPGWVSVGWAPFVSIALLLYAVLPL